MVAGTFENVQGQMGHCGIYCGSCVVGNGTLGRLSEGYEKLVRSHGVHEWGPADVDWSQFFGALQSMQGIPVCAGCRKGGGRESCELRACARQKGLDHCDACADAGHCEHTNLLEHMRSGAREAGLFVNTEDVNLELLMERWAAELHTRWPCCILFEHGQ